VEEGNENKIKCKENVDVETPWNMVAWDKGIISETRALS
jgi:hypothetical protein